MPTKAPKKQRNMANPKEVLGAFNDELGDLYKSTAKSLQKDFLEASGKDFMNQLLAFSLGGSESAAAKPQAEEGKSDEKFNPEGGVIFDASKMNPADIAERKARAKQEGHASRSEAHIHHGQEVRDAGKRGMQKEKQQRRSELEQVQIELRQIVKQTSQESQARYAPYTLTDLSREATVYQTSLLRQVLKGATMSKEQAADSGQWLKASKGKNAKKGGSPADLTKAPHEKATSGINSVG